jgi:bifunctional DNA-binding transcriptional regulator/antitoxin component of YhaV-PrlF toxin-antitoxin module
LDFDVPAAFGSRGRVSVKGTLAGHEFRSSISPRNGRWYLVVNQEMRRSFGIGPGDVVEVVLDRDDEPRTIAAPEDLQAAIDGSDAASSRWEAMSYSHRKQFVVWVEEAKRPATRQRRIGQAIPMIERGERRT